MNIAMFTNTFTPHIGGVAHSVSWLAEGLRQSGHRVLVVAPEFPGHPAGEADVIRIPAVENFRGSDFSVPLPLSLSLDRQLRQFGPDIIHSHHPFLLGDTALRVSASHNLPIVYTYHTRYELYGHYVAEDSAMLQRLVLRLALGYCDLCDTVIAPSQSMANFLVEHGVGTPLSVIPTGIDSALFAGGDGVGARTRAGIPADAFVVGHVGRLAPEKNLGFLAEAVQHYLTDNPGTHFLVAGDGSMMTSLVARFAAQDLASRVHFLGAIEGRGLADIYAAMDVFAFSSFSETQGLVLAEAMAAGVAVVALDATGVREIVRDGGNGRLLPADACTRDFSRALASVRKLGAAQRKKLSASARATADGFSRARTTHDTVSLYRSLRAGKPGTKTLETSAWEDAKRRLESEWNLLRNVAHAVSEAVLTPDAG